MSIDKDPYSVLGLQRDCSADDIKKAWRYLCRKHHPDNGGDADTFDDIQKAYQTLSTGMIYRASVRKANWTRGSYTYDGSPFRAKRVQS